jgi:lysophospholipase L1-like esterase
MKKHVLLFGDSNTWGYDGINLCRYPDGVRWTCQVKELLGDDYYVVEEGLSGRTTVFDDPLTEGLSGIDVLAAVLMSHMPLDYLVIMLGTNDTKARFAATAHNITKGLIRLVKKAQSLEVWRTTPKIMVVAPIKIDKRIYDVPESAGGMGPGCVEKSEMLPALYKEAAQLLQVDYMDANPYVAPAVGDWMHFDRQSNDRFAKAIAKEIIKNLEA